MISQSYLKAEFERRITVGLYCPRFGLSSRGWCAVSMARQMSSEMARYQAGGQLRPFEVEFVLFGNIAQICGRATSVVHIDFQCTRAHDGNCFWSGLSGQQAISPKEPRYGPDAQKGREGRRHCVRRLQVGRFLRCTAEQFRRRTTVLRPASEEQQCVRGKHAGTNGPCSASAFGWRRG